MEKKYDLARGHANRSVSIYKKHAVVLDAFSRKVVGWALDRSLRARLPPNALKQAIASRQPPAGLVHHSDQGVQYGSEAYMEMLRNHEMIPGISRPGLLLVSNRPFFA